MGPSLSRGKKKKKKWQQYELIEMASIQKKKKVTTSIGGENTPKPTSLTEQRELQEHCSGNRLNNTKKHRLDARLLGPTLCYSPPTESTDDLKIKPQPLHISWGRG